MNARQLRRAQERKERKLANKAEQQSAAAPFTTPFDPLPTPQPSEARVTANRANAQLSTGPKTFEGKAISSLNAVKSGLTGRTVMLPSEDAAEYQAHCTRLHNKWKPEGDDESLLVQSIADTEWRLRRIPALEFAIYAKGRTEFFAVLSAAKITGEVSAQAETVDNATSDPALIDLETFLRYEKQLRNLALQEGRLNRQRDKQIAELRQLQAERHALSESQAQAAITTDRSTAPPARPTDNGFVFSAAPNHVAPAPISAVTPASEPSAIQAQAA